MSSTPLSVKVVRSTTEFAALHCEWNALLENSPAFSVCLTWEWLYTWWNHYLTSEFELHILLLRDGDRLVGIAPFMLQSCYFRPAFHFRALRFLGTGEPEWEGVVSEYLDVIALVGEQSRVANTVWEYLHQSTMWDQILFNDLQRDSLVMTGLRQIIASDRFRSHLELVGMRYTVNLPPNVDGYSRLLDVSVAKRIAYKRRKLNRAGLVEVVSVAAQGELDHAFAELVRLHTLRWAREGKKGAFASNRFTAFHRQLAERLLPQGLVNIKLLSLNGANVAVLYNFRYRDTEYFYQGGFDINSAGKYSPGVVAHVLAIESAINAGLSRYDFMRGKPDSYKAEFGCAQASMHDMIVFGRTSKGRILATQQMVIRVLRWTKNSFRGLPRH